MRIFYGIRPEKMTKPDGDIKLTVDVEISGNVRKRKKLLISTLETVNVLQNLKQTVHR